MIKKREKSKRRGSQEGKNKKTEKKSICKIGKKGLERMEKQ